MVDELVIHNLVKIRSSLRVSRQDSRNKIACSVRNIDMLREGVAVLTNTPVRGFDIGRFEGWFSND